jgi:hypothetical protein
MTHTPDPLGGLLQCLTWANDRQHAALAAYREATQAQRIVLRAIDAHIAAENPGVPLP